MGYYLGVKKNNITKFASKWMELVKKNHPERGNADPERQYGIHSLTSSYQP